MANYKFLMKTKFKVLKWILNKREIILKYKTTIIVLLFGSLAAKSVTAEVTCPVGTMVEVPISTPDVTWTGASLQAYILANNITIPTTNTALATSAVKHFCQSHYGFTLSTPQHGWGETFDRIVTNIETPSYHVSQGIKFHCRVCNDGRALPAGPIGVNPDIDLDVTVIPRNGMTWVKNLTSATSGIVDVGCGAGVNRCNATQGDTSCNTPLPVLCINKSGNLPVPSWETTSQYHRWSGGVVATTEPVVPQTEPLLRQTSAEADQYCQSKFGPGWQVAEFHDGWGWNFKAYGNIGTNVDRFWVDINNQNANCWDQ
jgi:hypothetical protein